MAKKQEKLTSPGRAFRTIEAYMERVGLLLMVSHQAASWMEGKLDPQKICEVMGPELRRAVEHVRALYDEDEQ